MPTFEERKAAFLERYKVIMDELHIDLFSYPLYVADGAGGFKTVVQTDLVDTTDQLTPSPFVQ